MVDAGRFPATMRIFFPMRGLVRTLTVAPDAAPSVPAPGDVILAPPWRGHAARRPARVRSVVTTHGRVTLRIRFKPRAEDGPRGMTWTVPTSMRHLRILTMEERRLTREDLVHIEQLRLRQS